jgi:YegS/Rv2252/BmrU family lipid kinase
VSTFVIANPAAAAGRVGRERADLRRRIDARLGSCRYLETTRSGDGGPLARQAIDAGATRVLSLGGDGTHNEVASGVLDHPGGAEVTFGILPAGTGGDLRRTLGVFTLDEALAAIAERPSRRIDVGKATFVDDGGPRERWFANLASCGLSGLVDRVVNGSSKRLGGGVSFYLGTLRAMARYRPALVRIHADGRDLGEHAISVVVAGNGRFAGGGMEFCPGARLDDGLLDVLVIPHVGLLASIVRTPHLYRGTLGQIPGVVQLRAAEVSIETIENHAFLDLDGESPGAAPVVFRAHAARLLLAGAPR